MELYEIAYRLHIPLSFVLEMEYTELLGWVEYFSARPIGYSEDYRTYLLLSAQGVKEKPEKIFSSIAALKRINDEMDEQERIKNSLQNSGLLSKLISSAKQNNIEWNPL
jgi:hypothetical protein